MLQKSAARSVIYNRLLGYIKKNLRPLKYLYVKLFRVQDLSALAKLFRSDKYGAHRYTQHYAHHFSPRKHEKLKVLEIGIGGYDDPLSGGASLRMWKNYFPKSFIYGLDICDKKSHDERRVKTYQGSQIDEAFLRRVLSDIGKADIIIDDGSHQNSHVISTFQFLFPLLANDGIYVVEDTQTSYWAEYGGSSHELNSPETMMGFFKGLLDGLNAVEIRSDRPRSYFDKHIVSMHFYHNLIFIYKGDNDEPRGSSSADASGRRPNDRSH